jgi:sulfonate transport system substrate-binding protein
MTMTRMVTLALVVSVGLAAGACHRDGGKAKTLRIAIQPAPLYGPIFVAKQQGWIEQELGPKGVSVTWTSFPSGPPENESFAAGEQDVGVMGDSPAIIARSAGQQTRVVGMSATGPSMLAVVVPTASKIASPADLKGKKVAVVKGSYAHHLLALVLEGAHLGFGDVELVNLSHADIGTALQKGEIDAGAVWEPLLTKLVSDGTARVLQDGTGIKKGALVIIARQPFAEKNPELVQAVLRAYQRGNVYIRQHPAEAAELVSREVHLEAARLQKILERADFDPVLHGDDVEELKKSESFMHGVGITKTAVDIDAFIDRQYALAAGVR